MIRPRLLGTGLAAAARRRPAAGAGGHRGSSAPPGCAAHGRLLSAATLEKVRPGRADQRHLRAGAAGPGRHPDRLFAGLAVLVVANAAVILALARGGRGTDRALVAFGLRVVLNLVLVLVARVLLGAGATDLGAALFFAAMLSLITLLDDRYRPVQAARFAQATRASAAPGG